MIHFRASQIPLLAEFKVRQRQQIIAIALSHLSPITRVALSVCKLIPLVALFFALSYFQGMVMIALMLLAGISYPLFIIPIELSFAKKHLPHAIAEYKQGD